MLLRKSPHETIILEDRFRRWTVRTTVTSPDAVAKPGADALCAKAAATRSGAAYAYAAETGGQATRQPVPLLLRMGG